MNVTDMTRPIVTELIGGPLDGAEVELDEDLCSPYLDSVSIAWWMDDDSPLVQTNLIRYKVRWWRGQRLALVYDGYDDE